MKPAKTNVLFICSRNKWRSPTAEKIYHPNPRLNTRSAGISSKARRRVSEKDILWADLIIVMESKHKQRALADHPEATKSQEIHVLDIEDNYQFMDPYLTEELKAAIEPILATRQDSENPFNPVCIKNHEKDLGILQNSES